MTDTIKNITFLAEEIICTKYVSEKQTELSGVR